MYVGGFGPRMVEVAGEVADGLITHPFTTRQSLEEITLPALERGESPPPAATRRDVQVVCATLVVTAERDDELERLKDVARRAARVLRLDARRTRPTLECHGWGDLHPELNRLSKEGRWDDMAGADRRRPCSRPSRWWGHRRRSPARCGARLDGIADAVSLTNNRAPDPDHWAGVVAELTSSG